MRIDAPHPTPPGRDEPPGRAAAGAGRRFARNSLYGVASQAIGGGLFFLVAILTARYLGPREFGAFSVIFAIVAVLHIMADLGLTNILVREIARARHQAAEIVGRALPLVTLIALLSYCVVLLVPVLYPVSAAGVGALYLLGVSVPLTFHAAVFGAVCRGFEDMGYNAAALVLQRVVLIAFALLAIHFDWGLLGISFAYVMERLAQWLILFFIVRWRYPRYRWVVALDYWRYLVREGLPLGAGMVLRRLSWYVDTFILAFLTNSVSVGLFSAAYRVVQMISVLPFTLSVPAFPLLSRLAQQEPERAVSVYLRGQRLFSAIGVPIGVWLAMLGPELIVLLFGRDYGEVGATARIMGAVVVFIFLNSLYLYFFSALGRQRLYLVSVGSGLAVNIALDFVLIPGWDIAGAAAATLAGEVVLFSASLYQLREYDLGSVQARVLGRTSLLSGVAGAVLVWPLVHPGLLQMAFGSLAFGAAYLVLSWWLNRALVQDIEFLARALRERRAPSAADSGERGVASR